ncbi:MAG: NAD(P)/FAD-dependent oxidoreductase [Methanotrichaceae archaeon]|nr:NAD(P)/FAD-dependent oxidoreductase [Methanotrichaceae archaeon]
MSQEISLAVIGAGPAGSTAAEVAAISGTDLVLIERKNEIGTPVQCGGFLPEAAELKEMIPHAQLPITLKDVPEYCIRHRTNIQRIYAPSGQSKEFSVKARILDRRAFDRHLASRAAKAGAKILPATRAALINGQLKLFGRFSGSFRPKVVIGADGPLSSVAKSMEIGSQEMGLCLEYEMVNVNIDNKAAEMYFGAQWAPGGYAWIIPLGDDAANVGIGVRASYLGKNGLHGVLDDFIKMHPVASERLRKGEILGVMRGLVPAGGSRREVQKGRLLLAGDAAGHVMATSGGGIPLAMVAGRIAGEIAAGYLKGTCSIEDYSSRIQEAFGNELERSVQIRRLVDIVMHNDRLIDALFSVLAPNQMKSMMRAQMPAELNLIQKLLGKNNDVK